MSTLQPPSHPSKARHLSMADRVRGRKHKPVKVISAKTSVRRLILVWAILTMGTVGLGINLFRLQVVEAPELLQKARQQQIVYLRPFIPRRQIVDRQGNVLAFDEPVYTLYAHPRIFKLPKAEIASKLSPFLEKSPSEIEQQLNQAATGIQLKFSIPEETANQIDALQLDGLELIRHQQRFYPQQNLAADVLGYVDIDRQGQAGVEYSHQNFLERPVQTIRFTRTGMGMLIPNQGKDSIVPASEDLRLQLTIDLRLQRIAREALNKQLKQFNAKRGAVIVMDAMDGSLLSLVVEPTYDPNKYAEANLELFKNWAVTDLYEPGSTFKPLNVAIALEARAIQANDIFNDEGRIFVDGWPIQDYDFDTAGARGPLSVTEILKYSSNVGMVHIVHQMKREVYYRWLERMRLGQKSGVDLPFEMPSQLKKREQFVQASIESAVASFGQGLSITPIQLVRMHGALANGGRLVTPHVVRGLIDKDGKLYERPTLPPSKRLFSPRNARAVVNMMEKVVEEGTGKSAQIPGYRIAGKTGTAQKASGGGYHSSAKITSFVGIFPVDNPRYVVLAVMDEPKGGNAFGSTVTAPIVKAVMEAMIPIEGIPPSRPITTPKKERS